MKVIARAKDVFKNAGLKTSDHFPGVGKMVNLGRDSLREIKDIALTRYACYLVAS